VLAATERGRHARYGDTHGFSRRQRLRRRGAIAAYTIFGWRVDDIEAAVTSLSAKGVTFEIYGFFADAETPNGIWTAPGGNKVAWFKDPDGNLLSLSQHVT
jgi:hypothetical protein